MRTSGVKLVAETAGYKRDVKDAADATDKLNKTLSDTAGEAVAAKGGLDAAGKSAKGAGRDVDGLKRDLGQLDKQIATTEAALLGLSRAFAKTGDKSLLKDISGQQSALRQLTNVRKRIAAAGDDSAVGFAANFSKKLGGLLEQLPVSPQIAAAVGGAALVAAPLLGAAISGAIIGGAGIGGVVGGFLLVKKNPAVDSAIAGFTGRLKSRLETAASSFVQPTIGGIRQIERSLDQINFERIFANSSKYIEPLTRGIGSAMVDLGQGIDKLAANAGPVIAAISSGIAGIGEHLGKGLASLADNGEDAAAALKTIFGLIGYSIDTVFMLVNALTEAYGIMHKLGLDFGLQMILKMTGNSMDGVAQKTDKATAAFKRYNGEIEITEAQQQEIERLTRKSTGAQDALTQSMWLLSAGQQKANQTAAQLKTTMDSLYGAAIRQTDANESYEDSWDNLSESVKKNKRTLDIHTQAGRANRDALEALLTSSNELYLADINAGVSIAAATKKHQARTAAVKEEALRVGLNKDATQDLINTYGRIPAKKTTDMILSGVNRIVDALRDLYVFQRSLADGIPIASEIAKLKGEKGPAKRYGGYAAGGYFDGQLPGPPSSIDNLTGVGPDGRAVGLAGGEFIVNAKQTARHRTTLENINAGRDGFAAGGYYPVDTSRRWPFRVDGSNTRVPSRSAVEAKVISAVPSGGRTDDWIVRAVKAAFPGLNWISKYRPGAHTLTGNLSYHSMHRAVDWPPSLALAEWWNLKYKSRTKELITPWQDLNIRNGARHSYSPLVWNQHNFAGGNAHDHIAMQNGGVIGEPVVGVGRSGTTYSFAENGIPETVTPGLPQYQTARQAGGPVTYITNVNLVANLAAGANPAEHGRQIAQYLERHLSNGGQIRVNGRLVMGN